MPAGTGLAALALTDALGRVTNTRYTTAGQEYLLDLAGLAPGVHALRVQAGDAITTRKLVVE